MKEVKIANITDRPGFVKDMSAGTILNTDNNALAAYKAQKRLMREVGSDKARIAKLEDEVAELKKQVAQLMGK